MLIKFWKKFRQLICRHRHWEIVSEDDEYTDFKFVCCKCHKVKKI